MNHKDFFDYEEYLEEFKAFLPSVEYSDRNPLNTEMFFIWCMIRTIKPELFIESGTFRGYSATFICEALSHNENGAEFITLGNNLENCIPFARKRLEKYSFARVIETDSRKYLAEAPLEKRPTAFFIDGPKGKNMPPVFVAIQKRFQNVQFVAVHDCERESGSHNRRRVRQYYGAEFPIMFCDAEFQDPLQDMDVDLIGKSEVASWRPYHFRGKDRKSYGWETAYVLTRHPFAQPKLPRAVLSLYRRLQCIRAK